MTPFHGVGDDITVVELARELVPHFEGDGAPHLYVFVKGFDLTLDGSPLDRAVGVFHIDTGHGGVTVDSDVAETILWRSSGPCFIPTANWCGLVMLRTFLVRSLAVALQTSRLMTCPDGEGADSAIGVGSGDNSRHEVSTENLRWNVGSGESPKGFPHAVAWVSVEFCHPSPVLVPSTTRSRGSVGGREFDGEQQLAEEALLVFFGEKGESRCHRSPFWARDRVWTSFS